PKMKGIQSRCEPMGNRDQRSRLQPGPHGELTLLIVSAVEERHLVGMGDQPTIKIESATQLAVVLSNRPGALARVCEELAGAEINIHALAISDTADHSVVRMAVSDPTKALTPLGKG